MEPDDEPLRPAALAWASAPVGVRERSRLDAAPVRHFDYLLLAAVLAISALGLVMIYSSTHRRIPGDELYFVKRQAMFFGLGLVAMVGVIAIDYRRLRDMSMLAYFATVAVLVLVLAPVGSNIKGHQAWFQLPGGFTSSRRSSRSSASSWRSPATATSTAASSTRGGSP